MKSSTLEIWKYMTENPSEGFVKAFDKEKELLLKHVTKDSVFLDIGCGLGRILKDLAPHVKKVIGLDNDPEAIEKSKENIKEFDNVNVILGDAESLEFEDKSFDFVGILGGTISNLGNSAKKVFSEVKRTLKDEGLFFCSSWNEDALEERLKFYDKHYAGQFEYNKETGHVEVLDKFVSAQFSGEQLKVLVEENGFEVLDVIKVGLLQIVKARKGEESYKV